MNTYLSLAIALILIVSGYAYAVPDNSNKPGNVPPVAQNVIDRLDALEALIKRLHGNQAAVLNQDSSGSSLGSPGGYIVTLLFCDDPNVSCDANTSGVLQLQTELLTPSASDTIVTFDATNSPDFPAIATLLTNGENNVMVISTKYYDAANVLRGGGLESNSERGWFFEIPQVTTGPGFVDLAGLEIGNISISVDFLSLTYNPNTNLTDREIDYRIFFGLAP